MNDAIIINLWELVITAAVILLGLAASWGSLRNEIKNLGKRIGRVENIFDTLVNTNLERKSIKSFYSSANSPKELNELGGKLFEESGAKELFHHKKNVWVSEMERMTLDAALEVEQEAFKLLSEKMRDPEFKSVQNFAFNNPKFENQDLTYTDIIYVLSLELRNEYLKAHPEVS